MTEQTSKELARVGSYSRSTLTERQQYANALAAAGDLVPKSFWTRAQPDGKGGIIQPRPNPGAVLYMLETAAMLGVNPMVGLTNIHIIEGKPSLSANLQAALVREAGHRLRVWVDGDKAICEIVRSDDPDFTFHVEWGDAEMNAAGLASKDNWKKYQRSMKKARAITECIREACPEVLMGATYSPEELNPDMTVTEQGEPVELTHVRDEQPTAAPPEAPIVDKGSPVDTDWWIAQIENLSSREDALDLYRKGKDAGILNTHIMIGDVEQELGKVIIEVGSAFADAEKASEAEPSELPTDAPADDHPAVLEEDPDVIVEGEIVDDDNSKGED